MAQISTKICIPLLWLLKGSGLLLDVVVQFLPLMLWLNSVDGVHMACSRHPVPIRRQIGSGLLMLFSPPNNKLSTAAPIPSSMSSLPLRCRKDVANEFPHHYGPSSSRDTVVGPRHQAMLRASIHKNLGFSLYAVCRSPSHTNL